MIYILLTLTIICSAIMDNVMAYDSFAKYGLYFSKSGWKVKYIFTEWLNKYLPLWISKIIAQDILVIFLDIFHTAKTIMVASFIICIFGFTWESFIIWMCWGVLFNVCYYTFK